MIGREKVLLLGYQWPTQGGNREKKRCADLVGITLQGGLVVFEAKAANGTVPVSALLEGLDYLACLHRFENFEKIQRSYKTWIIKHGPKIDIDFIEVLPENTIRPTLVLLAPSAYYERYAKNARGSEWNEISRFGESWIPAVRTIVVETDYKSNKLTVPKSPK